MGRTARSKDNTTFRGKVELRRSVLEALEHGAPAGPGRPFVLDAYGGYGHIWRALYQDLDGVVMEQRAERVEALARQRPGWAVYEGDTVKLLEAGALDRWPVTFLDLDPYGSPWPALEAFFSRPRDWPERLGLAVNDGGRLSAKRGVAWRTQQLKHTVGKYGSSGIYRRYLEICQGSVADLAQAAGYRVTQWAGYYTGPSKVMTHYGAILER